jgi:hypothetical protein
VGSRPGSADSLGGDVELTILMPCLDEAATIGRCVEKAQSYLERAHVVGEVVVADNGSSDGSAEIAAALGARVVSVPRRGYGSALAAGISAARGRFVIMGDADDSYDFTDLEPFVVQLRQGADLVIGNRFRGGIARGAMPSLHRYVGNPALSFIGRRLFRTSIGDFHCGLRGFRREAVIGLGLQTTGMEFASEMIVRASLHGLSITEVPTALAVDGRDGPSHLRSWPDGWRHLIFMFIHAPRWLFFGPGIALVSLGLLFGVPTAITTVQVGHVRFDVDTLACAAAAVIVGIQALQFSLLANVYGKQMEIFDGPRPRADLLRRFSIGRVMCGSLLLVAAGLCGVVVSLLDWRRASFGPLDTRHQIRLIIPSITAIVVGCQLIFGRLFLAFLSSELSGGTDR